MAAGAAWVAAVAAGARPPEARTLAGLAAGLGPRVAAEGVGLVVFELDRDGARFAQAGRSGVPGLALDADTRFEWGSITKTATALLLTDAVQRRELALADAVEEVLPRGLKLRDSAGEPIRWLDLATHRSGLPRVAGNMSPKDPADPYADYGTAELEAWIAGFEASRRRGERSEYSNLGFGLLGHALGLRTGLGFAEAMRQRVLEPLGLPGVHLRMRDAPPIEGVAQGHDAARKPVPPWRFQTMAGAGALVGSARDLALYAEAALGLRETPLAPAFALSLAPQAAGIGLGWMRGRPAGRDVAQHDGGTYGFSSSLVLDLAPERDRRRAAAALANAFVVVTDLSAHLIEPMVPLRDVAVERKGTEREAVVLGAGQLAPLAGSYALSPQFRIVLRVREGRLFAQATGQGEFELFALSPTLFFARLAAIEVEFGRSASPGGPPVGFELRQAGQRLWFVRE